MKKQTKTAKPSSAVLRGDKPAKSSTAPKKAHTTVFLQDRYCAISHCMKPTHPTFIREFFEGMIDWAITNERAYKAKQYCELKGIYWNTMQRWLDYDPSYREMYNHVLDILGNRREAGWIEKKYEPSAIRLSMRHYDKDWVALTTEDESKGNVTVVMQAAPTTKEVPDKK
jgi:hypothetical protein